MPLASRPQLPLELKNVSRAPRSVREHRKQAAATRGYDFFLLIGASRQHMQFTTNE